MRLHTPHAAEATHCLSAACISSLVSTKAPNNLKLWLAGRERDRTRWPTLLGSKRTPLARPHSCKDRRQLAD
eukprot:5077331-Pyramimonas_sp.AAC.1